LRLRLLTTTYLEQAHFFRGEYQRVVELTTDNLAALPAGSDYESFESTGYIAIYNWFSILTSLTQLGRFAEAAPYEAEALRFAAATNHASALGEAHVAAGWLHLRKGEWAKARSLIEPGIAAFRTGNNGLNLPRSVAYSAWVLAQVDEARHLGEHAVESSPVQPYWRTGKREQAQEHLTTATTMFREMDMPFWLEKAEAETGGLV